jgi:hypothetical protein
MRRWAWTLVVTLGLLGGESLAYAADPGPPTPPITGSVQTGGCGAVGFLSQDILIGSDAISLTPGVGPLTPGSGVVAAQVTLAVPCDGLVIATFTSEVFVSSGAKVLVVLQAACVEPEVAGGCLVSDPPVAAHPRQELFLGPVFAWNNWISPAVATQATHSTKGIFPALKRGTYEFTVEASVADNTANVLARSLEVQAFAPPPPTTLPTGSGRAP